MKEQDITKYDNKGMFELIKGFPEQCRDAERIAREHVLPDVFSGVKNIVVAGMGGSAIGGDLLKNCLCDELDIPLVVLRDYDIPRFVGPDTLFLAASYSGDTEETLSTCNQAFVKSARVLAVTSGGELERICSAHRAPVLKIPGGMPPRSAVGYMFFSMLIKLEQIGLIADKSQAIKSTISLMEKMRENLSSSQSEAGRLAGELHGKIPVIYGSSKISESAAFRWRTQINENSKMLASTALFPEMNHNEIVGWEHPRDLIGSFKIVLLKDSGDNDRVKSRMEITESLLDSTASGIEEVSSSGESLLERIFSLLYFGDFVSFYLAILNRVDPTPVDRIQLLKERLKKI